MQVENTIAQLGIEMLPSAAAMKKMNRLAAEGRSFLFVVDFDQAHCIVEEAEKIPADKLQYSFPGASNTRVTHSAHEHTDVEWNVKAPDYGVYSQSFETVMRNIRMGNSYLANLTTEAEVATNLPLHEIFRRSKALYKLWIKDCFVCFSPENFIRIDSGGSISSYPMKGTISADIPSAREILENDAKEAAEHATIVDLIRNDLSIVASGVHVAQYRYFDLLRTNKGSIYQTSSEVRGQLPGDYRQHIGDIVFSQLPAGSITGAPKNKTVEIIREAETYRRGFYTGIMGYYNNGMLDSAVMIRFIENRDGHLYFKAGGGITSQSDCQKEYDEVIQKIYVPIR